MRGRSCSRRADGAQGVRDRDEDGRHRERRGQLEGEATHALPDEGGDLEKQQAQGESWIERSRRVRPDTLAYRMVLPMKRDLRVVGSLL
jgi:hypothetical protein